MEFLFLLREEGETHGYTVYIERKLLSKIQIVDHYLSSNKDTLGGGLLSFKPGTNGCGAHLTYQSRSCLRVLPVSLSPYL